METNDKFYLGRIFDPTSGRTTDQPLLYDPADLTTHAVVVGMTGSGKTGLCLDLLEEAALNSIPAMMIDLKGDITNALLHFPNLAPQDFLPWVNADQARREGKTLEQAAAEAAASAGKGLAEWGIEPERLRSLQNAVQFAVYTPGSDAGLPVNILASLKAPPIPWESNRELLREKISGTVTALLGLVGLSDVDPVRSREHILLSNIFEYAWSQGKDLDLSELILQTQAPPFPKLGVFDVNIFFPEKDRFNLAMLLNNILAAPAFQSWIEGQPLDIPGLLNTADGQPRHCVFYIAHLSDAERMFFVSLLFSAVEAWMRSLAGTSTLRAVLYFDEIFGYMPPTANPASKQPMLRMLKQARAFGIGLVLVTQNPVDMDYKALSNAGTWFIGKLQTDQDKQRLLDGLESALEGGLDRGGYDRMISTLGKRVFLLHNVHAKGPQLFQTRWAMNYLAGPLTRAQIPELNKLVAANGQRPPIGDKGKEISGQPIPMSPETLSPITAVQPTTLNLQLSTTRAVVPAGVKEYFLPNNLTFTQAFKAAGRPYPAEAFSQGLVYRPTILAQASIRFLNRKYNLDYVQQKTVIVQKPDRRGVVRWDNFTAAPVDPSTLDEALDPQARFASLEAPFSEAKVMTALQKDFLDWAYRTGQVTVHGNEALKLYAGPGVTEAEFRTTCAETARQERDDEIKKVSAAYDAKLINLQEKLARKERELSQDQSELTQRKVEEGGTILEVGASLFGLTRKRSLTTPLTKHRLTEKAKADVQESQATITDMKKQMAALESEKAQAVVEVNNRWGQIADQVSEIPIAALKKDVLLDLFGVVWVPYHQVKIGEEIEELPGYSEEDSK